MFSIKDRIFIPFITNYSHSTFLQNGHFLEEANFQFLLSKKEINKQEKQNLKTQTDSRAVLSPKTLALKFQKAEAYSGPCQSYIMEIFCENN